MTVTDFADGFMKFRVRGAPILAPWLLGGQETVLDPVSIVVTFGPPVVMETDAVGEVCKEKKLIERGQNC